MIIKRNKVIRSGVKRQRSPEGFKPFLKPMNSLGLNIPCIIHAQNLPFSNNAISPEISIQEGSNKTVDSKKVSSKIRHA